MTASKPPITETKTVSEARRTFSETLNRVYHGETRVVIEKNGIPVGVLVSPDDLDRLVRIRERRDGQWAAIDRLREAFADVDQRELNEEIARAVADVRRERKDRHAPDDSAA